MRHPDRLDRRGRPATAEEPRRAWKKRDGIIIPQGWGSRGAEERSRRSSTRGRTRPVPRPLLRDADGGDRVRAERARGCAGANSEEVDAGTPHPVDPRHAGPAGRSSRQKRYGGSIRVGAYPCRTAEGSGSGTWTGRELISERHRHRYEFNNVISGQYEAPGSPSRASLRTATGGGHGVAGLPSVLRWGPVPSRNTRAASRRPTRSSPGFVQACRNTAPLRVKVAAGE